MQRADEFPRAGWDLSGRVAIVTGGTKGIGRRIVEVLAEHGATVETCGRQAPDPVMIAAGRPVGFTSVDVRDPEAVDAWVDDVVERHGRLDIVVNNAGGAPPADAATASPRFSEAIVRLNLLAPLFVAQAANRHLQPGGVIVNIASVSAQRPSPGTAAYGAAKAGLISLTRSLAIEWAPRVRVCAVVAGLIGTDRADDHYGGAEAQARVAATVPLGRLGRPDDIAGAVLYLTSPWADWVSGGILEVHGGGEAPPFLEAAAD